MIAKVRSVLLLASLCSSGPALTAQTLQLADGRILLGKIESTDSQGIRVKRLDNGGTLDLRWEQLSPAEVLRIQPPAERTDDFLVPAVEVVYTQNGTRQSIFGIADPGSDPLIVTVKGVPMRIPRTDLLGVHKVQVPATQVYSKDEFYSMRASELQPGSSADKHIQLAGDLIAVRDYEHAGEHLARAKELGNATDPKRLDQMQQKLQSYKDAAKEREMLDQIQAARSRGSLSDFEKGRKWIEQFPKDFPQSRLKADFELEKKRFEAARTRFLTEQVADQWRRSIQIVADKKAADTTATLANARDYAEAGKMTDDIVARLAAQLRIEATEVKTLWAGRENYPAIGKRTEHFGYGIGSWVLGAEKILKGTTAGKAAEKKGQPPPTSGNTPAVDRLAKLMREALEQRRKTLQSDPQGARKLTEEDWWRQATRAERVAWLRAYYAEYGQQLKVAFQTVSECVSCYGEGTIPEIGPDGKLVRSECFLCQGTKWTRSFKAY